MSNESPRPPGPDRTTLLQLKAMMPSFIKGLRKGKIGGRGIPAKVLRPRKVCKVCCLLYDKVMISPTAEQEIKSENCEPCAKALKDGYTAIYSGEYYAFIKAPDLADMAGQIKHVSPMTMAEIKKRFGAKVRQSLNLNESDDEKQQPPNPA